VEDQHDRSSERGQAKVEECKYIEIPLHSSFHFTSVTVRQKIGAVLALPLLADLLGSFVCHNSTHPHDRVRETLYVSHVAKPSRGRQGSLSGTPPFSSDIWQPFPASKTVVCFIGMFLPIALFSLSHDTSSCDEMFLENVLFSLSALRKTGELARESIAGKG
jgi:hypothetical protein